MDEYGAEYLFPGHGPPIVGAKNVREALCNTALYLEVIEREVVKLMNEGKTLNEILIEVNYLIIF
jgi:alkyl sulfatase BDS1-like metallo-beta-lactamase superfamily hydrolase